MKKFSDARPPGIYKSDYIDALYTYYHEKRPEMVICPPTPEWKRSSDLDLNGEAMPDEDDDGNLAAPVPVSSLKHILFSGLGLCSDRRRAASKLICLLGALYKFIRCLSSKRNELFHLIFFFFLDVVLNSMIC